MKLKKYILFSAIPVFSIFASFGMINNINKTDNEKELATVVEAEKKEPKSMIDCMREQGEPEHVINHTIEMMEKYGYNPYDFVAID